MIKSTGATCASYFFINKARFKIINSFGNSHPLESDGLGLSRPKKPFYKEDWLVRIKNNRFALRLSLIIENIRLIRPWLEMVEDGHIYT